MRGHSVCWWVGAWIHDDVIKWKQFPHYWPFVRGIHQSPVNSPHKGQWHGALMFSLIYALNERLSKQSWGWSFETPSRSLWRHYNALRFESWASIHLAVRRLTAVLVVVNFISDRQYKNKDNLLTKQNTTLVIAVRGHQRSPWAHRAGGLTAWSQSQEVRCYNASITLKFDRHLGSSTGEMPVKLQSNRKSLTLYLTASRVHEILRQDVRPLSE